MRKRHVWLSTPLKKKRLTRRKRLRIGLEQALERKRAKEAAHAARVEQASAG